MDRYYVERPIRTIEDSFRDLETLFRNKNKSQTPRITFTEELHSNRANVSKFAVMLDGMTEGVRDNNYVAAPRLPLISPTLGSPIVQSPLQPVDSLQDAQLHLREPTITGPPLVQPRAPSPVMPTHMMQNAFPPQQISRENWKVQQKKSSAIIPPWIHVPENSRFFVIKSSSLEHVKKSFYNGIWSSTFYGNKRLSEAYDTLPEGGKVYLLFSVNASGRFCGVAEMSSGLREDLDTSIWEDSSRYRNAFKVRWIVVRDVHNRSLKQFLIPSNDMKPVTNSRDTQEIPSTICKSILKLFKYEQSEVQSFLDDYYP